MRRTPQPRVSDPEGRREDEIRHTGAQRGATTSSATSGFKFSSCQDDYGSFRPRHCVWESCSVDQPRMGIEAISQPLDRRPNSAAPLFMGDRAAARPESQFMNHVEQEWSHGCYGRAEAGIVSVDSNVSSHNARPKSGNESALFCHDMYSVVLQQVNRKQGSSSSDRASNNRFDDGESDSEPELVDLFRTNDCSPRSDDSPRQVRPSVTPRRSSRTPEPPAYQPSPRPPSITVDDMRMAAEGNMTPEPWHPPTQVPASIPLLLRRTMHKRKPTPPELRFCMSPTIDEEMRGLTKADVCVCGGTGIPTPVLGESTSVARTQPPLLQEGASIRESTPSTIYRPIPRKLLSSKSSSQGTTTAGNNGDLGVPAVVSMVNGGAQPESSARRAPINGGYDELGRTSTSSATRRRLPDTPHQPPPVTLSLSPAIRRLVEINRNNIFVAKSSAVGASAAQKGECIEVQPMIDRQASNTKCDDVSTSTMVRRRLPEIPRGVQPFSLDEVRRILDEHRLKLDKRPPPGSRQLAGPDLQPLRIRRLKEPTRAPDAIHRADVNVDRPGATRTADCSNGLRAAVNEHMQSNVSGSARAALPPNSAAIDGGASGTPTPVMNVLAGAHAAQPMNQVRGMPFILMNSNVAPCNVQDVYDVNRHVVSDDVPGCSYAPRDSWPVNHHRELHSPQREPVYPAPPTDMWRSARQAPSVINETQPTTSRTTIQRTLPVCSFTGHAHPVCEGNLPTEEVRSMSCLSDSYPLAKL